MKSWVFRRFEKVRAAEAHATIILLRLRNRGKRGEADAHTALQFIRAIGR